MTLSTRTRHANGEWRHLEVIANNRLAGPSVNGIVLSMRDVTARNALEDELRHQSFHDALTGLALPDRAPFKIGVNVSTRQLQAPGFPDLVEDVLASTEMEPRLLVLEITESLLPEDGAAMIEQLGRLNSLGVRIAVDDFGTGYSALSRLHHFPIHIVKIDRSFIAGIERDGNKAQLVQGIVSLAESLDLDVVAPDRLWAPLQDPDVLAAAA